MNGKKTPLMQVNDEHGGKTKLVDKIVGSLERSGDDEDESTLKARLMKASNKKLLRLLAVSSTIRDKYGSVEKLAEAIGGKLNRVKDTDYLTRLGSYTPARLLDMARSLAGERRRPMQFGSVRPAEKPAAPVKVKPAAARGKKAAPARKAAPAKKPAAKKPAAKKPAARKGAKS
jgi:hypothetical protein